MASGKDNKYSRCSFCLDEGQNTVAKHYCVDCETYFCTVCVKCHKLPSLKSHQVNDVNTSDWTDVDDGSSSLQSDAPSESVHRLRCTIHHGKLMDTHCKNHDEVCCGSCAVMKHRSCTTVSIAIAAKDFKSSPNVTKLKEALTENLVQSKREKDKRTDNLDSIGQQKLELIEDVDKYEEKIIARIKELADISRNEIRSKYEEHKTALDSDIEALDVAIATSTEYIDILEQMEGEQLFAYAKTIKTVTRDGEMLLKAMTKDWKKRGIRFCFDHQAFEKRVLEMKSLGRLDEFTDTEYPGDRVVTEYKATFHSKVNVKLIYNSHIFDICLMDNNDFILTDDGKKLTRFDPNLQFKDEMVLSGRPVSVCKTDNQEVAVRIQSTNVVQFVAVGQSMQLTSSFTLANDGYGMTYDAGTREVLACEEDKVSVYSKTGNKLRTFEKDANGEKLFSACRQIALSENKEYIYVTDQYKGLIVLNVSGTLKLKVSLLGVTDTWPLCILPGDICLLGSFYSGVIVQVDKAGKQVDTRIDTNDGRRKTSCVVYDREHSRLIVGGYPGVLSVYTLSATYK